MGRLLLHFFHVLSAKFHAASEVQKIWRKLRQVWQHFQGRRIGEENITVVNYVCAGYENRQKEEEERRRSCVCLLEKRERERDKRCVTPVSSDISRLAFPYFFLRCIFFCMGHPVTDISLPSSQPSGCLSRRCLQILNDFLEGSRGRRGDGKLTRGSP